MSKGFLKAICRLLSVGSFFAVLFVIFSGQTGSTQPRAENILLPTPAPAAGAQLQPQIAKGSNTSLVVWSDRRTVLGRYVPDDSAGIGSGADIYAARLDAEGNLVDTVPIVVNQDIYDQYYPHVSWNGQNFLVAWATVRKTNQFEYDVKAVRIAPDGTILDAVPIVLTNGQNITPNYLSVASDGANFIVVWGSGGYQSTVNASRISASGTLLDSTPKALFTDTNFTAPFFADIAFANNQFLVVWQQLSSADRGVKAQRYSANLDPVGAPVLLGLSDSDASPRVASDGTNFLVIWRESRFAYNEIFAARISAAGENLDPNGIKLFGSPGDFVLAFNTALAWDGTAYVAAYHARPVNNDESIFANRIQTNGTASAAFPVTLNTGATQPAVAALAGGGAKIVWVDRRLSADGDIFGAKLLAGNTVETANAVSLAAPRETQVRFTKTAAGTFAYVYRSTISGASSIYLQRLDANGNPTGEPTLVAEGAEAIMTPAVAWNGTVYLVVWELNGQTFGRRVAADGTPVGAEFLVSTGDMPDVAALGTQFLVVNSFPRTNELRHTQATRVSGEGTVAAPVRIGNNFDIRPRVRAFATRWLVVWESDISHDNPNSNIAAAFVEPDGTSPGEFSVSGSNSDAPALAIGGDTALVVWMSGGKIYGRRVKQDGSLPAASFIVAQGPRSLYAPAAAWDGARFVVTYADPRNRTILPPADIWATLVSLSDTILTPNGFPVSASPLPEEQPSVEAANGTSVFGFSKFEDRAPFTSYRVRLRRFPFDAAYSLTAAPFQRTIQPGAGTTYNIAVNPQNGFSGAIELGVYGLPPGATAAFSTPVLTNGGASVLTITTSSATPEDIYRATVTATSGAQQSTAEIVLFVSTNPPPVGYSVTDLGSLGGNEGIAYDINNNGQAVGYSKNASQKRRAFIYANGQMQEIPAPAGVDSTATAINDAGTIAGFYFNSTAGRNRAFSYDGAFHDLGALSEFESFAMGINSAGIIVGSTDATGGRVGFIYQNSQMQPLPAVSANDINNAGKIVGSDTNSTPAYVYFNGQKTSLGTLGGRYSDARAINENDQIVGSAEFEQTSIFSHAFLYQNGQMRDLNFTGAPQSFAYDINNSGVVVGNFNLTQFGDPRAFVSDGTMTRNLNTLISQDSGWTLNVARGINDNGQIVGQGTLGGVLKPFLLTPNAATNAPPTVQITNPISGQNLVDPSAITINAAATDADGAVVRVEFFADGALIGTATTNPFTILWTNYQSNRTYTLTAKATDNNGAVTVSAPVTVTTGINTAIRRTQFDFDGDGRADISVYRGGEWHLSQTTLGYAVVNFGLAGDKLTPADYDGDGKTDIAVYRGGTWYLLRSTAGFGSLQFGLAEDIPQPADFDGDGRSEIAVFRPSTGVWYIYNLATNQTGIVQFGLSEDKPVAADYTGDGRAEIAVWRPSTGDWYHLNLVNNQFGVIHFGQAGDVPVSGDYDGDGKADFAVFRGGVWYLQQSTAGFGAVQFGLAGDIPTAADFDGDGKTNIGVFREGVWYYLNAANGAVIQQFGLNGDVPVESAFNP